MLQPWVSSSSSPAPPPWTMKQLWAVVPGMLGCLPKPSHLSCPARNNTEGSETWWAPPVANHQLGLAAQS